MPDDQQQDTFIPNHNPEPTEPLAQKATSPIPVIPQLAVALGMLLLVFGVSYFDAPEEQTPAAVQNFRVEKRLPIASQVQEKPVAAFEDINIEAENAIVWDVTAQRVLFNKNADAIVPLASVAKLMTALVAYEMLDPRETVAISAEAVRVDGDSGLREGDTFLMRDLADLVLVESSNDGAYALGAHAGNAAIPRENGASVFVTAMNLKAQELGLSTMRFYNSTGLDESENEAGAYGSARDVAHLMEYLITEYPEAAELTTQDTVRVRDAAGKIHTAYNTNDVVTSIDGLIASKTGYTLLAGGNLAIATNIGLNRPVIIVVMGSSLQGRFSDTLRLLDEVRAAAQRESST